MDLPIKFNTSQFATEVFELYKTWNLYKNLKEPTTNYFEITPDPDTTYLCCLYYQEERIKQCKDNIIFIDCFKEGWHILPTHSTNWPKDKHYFILSSADWDTTAPLYQLDFEYTLLYFPWVLFDTVRAYTSFKHELFFCEKNYDFKYPKELSFSSMSSSINTHRDFVVQHILPLMPKDSYAFKYAGINHGKNIQHLDIVSNIDQQNFAHYHQKADKYFAITHNKELQVSAWQYLPIDIYNISYYNLITESSFKGSHFFPTEKIWKPIVTGIPFVCIATQNFLQRVRDLGFKTYNSVWDESYDTEPNEKHRLEMIADLCVQLQTFDWQSNRQKLIDIANHNKLQLQQVSSIFDDHFTNMENKIKEHMRDSGNN